MAFRRVLVCGPRWKLVRNALGAEVLIVEDDRALLVRRAQEPWRGSWELPGGFVEVGEHPAAAARREIAEELGVVVRLTGILGFYMDPRLDEVVEVVTFCGEVDGELELDAGEVSEARWFSATNYRALLISLRDTQSGSETGCACVSGEPATGLGFDPPTSPAGSG